MMGSNEPKDDFALRLLNDVETWRKDKAEKMRKLREERKDEERKGEETPKTVPQVVNAEVVQVGQVAKPKKQPKNVFGEMRNVHLTADEEDKLRQRVGTDFDLAISILSNYKASSGRSYKSDYAAILNWVLARIDEEKKKRGSNVSQAQRLAMGMIGGMNG